MPCLELLTELAGDIRDELSFPLDGLVAFDGDGHYYHCLDYRQHPAEPQVTYVDIECDHHEVLAESFDDFLRQLVLETEDKWVIRSALPLAEVVALMQARLPIRFGAPDDFAHGYPIYSAKFGGHWLFLSPNQVAAAFARRGERHFKHLSAYAGQTALRYPELAATDSLLEGYEAGLVEELIQKLQGALEIVPLAEALNGAGG